MLCGARTGETCRHELDSPAINVVVDGLDGGVLLLLERERRDQS